MFQPHSVQLLRTLTVFVVTGWACAVAVRITDSGTTAQDALLGPTALRAAALGLAAGFPFAPLAAWSKQTGWKRLLQGALAGTCAGVLGVTVYFWLWPPEWNAGHIATLKMFYKTYGIRVVPLGTAGGIFATLWSSQHKESPPTPATEG